MSPTHRISAHRLAAAIAGLLVVMAATAAPPPPAAARPLASAARVAADVQHATGYSASALSTRAACGSTPPGAFRCYARILTVRSTGRAVTPLHAPRPEASVTGPAGTTASSAPAAYTAAFLQSAYDTTWLSANEGAGDTVAIVDAYGDAGAYTDMEQFRSANGLAQIPLCSGTRTTSCFQVVNQYGQTTHLPTAANDETGSWNIEESLDIDAVSSLCPECKILMVEANSDDSSGHPDLEDAVQTAAQLGANQISLSWGADVAPNYSANESPYSSITSAAVLAAAGDSSYPGPYVGYPAALPSVTAVGGTALTASPTTPRGYFESTWSLQTCAGGVTCATESGCDTSQPVPSFQRTIATGCSGRAYNDLSADADPSTGLEIYDSQPGSEGCGTSTNWCTVGGTSLATPLAAALEGVTGVAAAESPAWTYSNASLLNDITAGSDGNCPSAWSLICNARTGWDGPTGNGSISGDLANGGPVIGGNRTSAVNGTDATLTSGLYPGGQSTSYHWLYWASGGSASSGVSTPSASTGGNPLQTVSGTICGTLTPSTTYYYELIATNASGSATGQQASFTTASTQSAPTSSSRPTISGSAVVGQTLTGTDAVWNNAGCNSAPTVFWQTSPNGSDPWTTVASGLSYALTTADSGHYLRLVSTDSNGAGSTTVTSAALGPVTEPPQPSQTSSNNAPPVINASGGQATAPSTTPVTQTRTTTLVRFYRCAHTCTLLKTHGATSYRPTRADYGRYIKVVTTISRITGGTETSSVSTRWLGPVRSATAGSIALGSRARVASTTVIRGSAGRALAQLRLLRSRKGQLTLVVRRTTAQPTEVWAYVVAGGRVLSGTRSWALPRPATLRFTLKAGQTIRLVAVRT